MSGLAHNQTAATYAYDANRRLSSITDPRGAQTQFGYNRRGQVTSLTDPKTNVT